jgi:hypothetical protein
MDSMSSDERTLPPGALVLPAPKKPKMIRRASRRKYVEVITIRDGVGKGARISQVCASAKDNRLENIILASKMRNLIEKQVDLYTDGTLTGIKLAPKDLLETTQAIEKITAVTYRAHGDVIEKEKPIPELPAPSNVQNNQTNIGNLIVGGGQTAQSMSDILKKVGSAASVKNGSQ